MQKYSLISEKVPHLIYGADYNPDQWQDYQDVLREDVRLMKKVNLNCVTMPIFAWAQIEPSEGEYHWDWLDERIETMYQNGIFTIMATPSGARPAWMDKKYPEVRRVSPNRVRILHGDRHNHCYTSPIYRDKVKQMNTLLAKRYGHHPGVIMWHISNEYGGECHCELCQEAFREFLRARYQNNIDQLNHAYWSSFWSHHFSCFEEIESPAPHGETLLHGLTLDWKRFVTAQTSDFLTNEIVPIKSFGAPLPITTNFMGTYPVLDYAELSKHIDVISWDSYPQWHDFKKADSIIAAEAAFVHDLNRSLKSGQPFMVMESTPSCVNWAKVNRSKQPEMNYLSSMLAIAHGSDSIQYFQWRKGRGGSEKFHGAVVDHDGRDDNRIFKECERLGVDLQKLDEIAGCHVPSVVAIVFDWENRWAIEDIQGLNDKRSYVETCQQHYRYFHDNGIPVDVISSNDDFSRYDLLILPMLYMLRPGVANQVKSFVEQGGTLVTTYLTGYVNESDLCFLGGFPGDGMGTLMGLRTEEIDPLHDGQYNYTEYNGKRYQLYDLCEVIQANDAEVLSVYEDDFYKGKPVITKHRYGSGTSYHIAARSETDLLIDFYKDITQSMDLNRAVSFDLPSGVFAAARYSENKKYVFLLNFNIQPKTLHLGSQRFLDIIHAENITGSICMEGRSVRVLVDSRKECVKQ